LPDTLPPPPAITSGRLLQHRLKNFSRKMRGKSPATMRLYSDGPFLEVHDHSTAIVVFPDNRWGRFSGGVLHRCEETARQYCLDHYTGSWTDATFLDLGANIGEVSLYAVSRGAKAHAFEADPHVFQALSRNARRHCFAATHTLLGAEEGTMPFYLAPADADSSLIPPKGADTASLPSVQLPVTPLDSATQKAGLDRIDVIKLDAEGAEPEVLSGAGDTLKRTQFIAVDCSAERQGEETVEACLPILEAAGLSTTVNRGGPAGRVILTGRR
jgi:FkbM family methyltransferase